MNESAGQPAPSPARPPSAARPGRRPFFLLLLFSLILPAGAQEDAIAPAPPLLPAPGAENAAAAALLGDGSEGTEAPADGAALLAECAARMPCERVMLAGTLNMRRRYGVSIRECAFEVAADWRTPDTPADYRLTDPETGETLLAARSFRDPARGLVVERTDGGPAPASPAEPILGTDISWLDVGIDFVSWRNPALAGEDRLKGRVCDLLDVEPPAPLPGCAKARLWIDRAQKVVMQAAQLDENGREVRKLWVRAVQKVDGHWIFKDLEVETPGSGHRTRLHFEHAAFPDSALRPADGGRRP
ncbi:MAG: outer membrane lipoprotein-sorting protein [Kiritimatiellae bacterium]|nr:outer membrane lipoprotein-sorting protein [Kiritimatiellia bacterium]